MSPKGAIALTFGMVGLMLFFSGGLLALLLGFEYATTSLAIGTGFLVLGGIALAIPSKPRPPAAAGAVLPEIRRSESVSVDSAEQRPTKVVCPDCGASPSSMPLSGPITCEYCGTVYFVR